jgi:hypothetical protein
MIKRVILSRDRSEEFHLTSATLGVMITQVSDNETTKRRSLSVSFSVSGTEFSYRIEDVFLFRSITEELFSDIYGEYVAAARTLPERVVILELSDSGLLRHLYRDEEVAAVFRNELKLRHYVFFLTDEILDVVTGHQGIVVKGD